MTDLNIYIIDKTLDNTLRIFVASKTNFAIIKPGLLAWFSFMCMPSNCTGLNCVITIPQDVTTCNGTTLSAGTMLIPKSKRARLRYVVFCVLKVYGVFLSFYHCRAVNNHRHGNVILMSLSLLAAPRVVILTTFVAANDEYIVKMTPFLLQ